MANTPKDRNGRDSWEPGIRHAFRKARILGNREPPVEEPEPLSRYEIHDELARDTASVLHLARDREVDRDVTLRVLGGDGNGDRTSVRRFLEEAQVGAQLQHPGILPVYGLGLLEDGRAYVASKIVEGKTLAGLMESKENRERLLAVLEHAAHALTYAHARGVAHGSLDATRIHVGTHKEVVISGWERAVRASWDAHRIEADVEALLDLLETVLGKTLNGNLKSAGAIARAIGRHLAGRETRVRKAELAAASARVRAQREKTRVVRSQRKALRERAVRQRILAGAAAALLIVLLGLGGLHLRAGEEAAEKDRVEVQFAAALREARRHETAGDWAEARAFANKAVALAPGEMRTEAKGLLARIEDTARLAREDKALLARLEEIRLEIFLGDGTPDGPDAFRKSFREIGLDPRSMDPKALATALRARTRPLDLVAEMDFWAVLAPAEFKKPLLVAAGLVDPHPWRQDLRRIYLERDFEGARALADTVDTASSSQTSLYLLAHVVGARDLPRAAAVCREARLRRPDDVLWRETLRWNLAPLAHGVDRGWRGVNIVFGSAGWRPAETREWSLCLASAVASMPDDAATWAKLGCRLATLGETARARAALQRSIALKPATYPGLHELVIGLTEIGDVPGALTWARKAVARSPESVDPHYLLGVVLCDHVGDFEGAVREFRETLRLGRVEFAVYQSLSRALFELGDMDAAADASRQAYDVIPDSRPGEKFAALARVLCHEEQWEKAAETFRQALQHRSDDNRTHYGLANCLNILGHTDEALEHARQAVALAPRSAHCRHLLGSLLCEGYGDYEGAIREFREGLKVRPKAPVLHRSLGNALVGLGRMEEAAEEYRIAHELAPMADVDDKLRSLGMSQSARGEHREALATFKRALRHRPDDYRILTLIGQELGFLGREIEAVPVLRRALSRTPKRLALRALCLLATALQRLGKFEESLAAADRAIELAPDVADGYVSRGYALGELKRTDEAIDAYLRAIELGPRHPHHAALAHSNLGGILTGVGRFREAIPHLRRATQLDPSNPHNHLNLGRAQERIGDIEGAFGACRAGLRQKPDDYSLLNFLAWHRATAADAALRNPEEAVAFAERALRTAPAKARGDILNTYGVALYRAERFVEAIKALEESLRLSPSTGPYNGLFIAMAHLRLGRRDPARKWFENTLRWMEANPSEEEKLLRFRAEAEALFTEDKSENEK
jgi:tetratricopeptide (TPR) repeat protein